MLLPTGEPLYEKVGANQFHPPTVIEMLRAQRLTGYARFSFNAASAILVFVDGALADAVVEAESDARPGADVLAWIFERLAAESGLLDVYRMTPELVACVRALLRGEPVLQGQLLAFLNVKSLLQQIKDGRRTACLRVYTDERTALIFYAKGAPVGFFHDGSSAIETTADISQSIARLPGAKLDVLTLPDGAGPAVDLCAALDLGELWKQARARQALEQTRRVREREDETRRRRAAAQADLARDLRQILLSALGSVGGSVFEKVLADRLARAPLRPEQCDELLAALATAAKLLVGATQARELTDAVRARLEAVPDAAPPPP